MDKLAEILLIVSESPLAWSAFIIFLILSFIVRLQIGKAEKLTKEIRYLPPEDRIRAIERLYSDVPTNSPESYLKAKRQYFRFVYYVTTLIFIVSITYIFLFYTNKIVPSILPFMPPPTKIVREIPESGTVNSNVQGYIDYQRFLINFDGCKKESTSFIFCNFKIENKSGDKDFTLIRSGSRIVENSGDILPCNSVKISSNNPSSSSTTKLISGIPTTAIYTFDGVADDVNSIAAIEAVVQAEGEYLTLQYKNVPLQ